MTNTEIAEQKANERYPLAKLNISACVNKRKAYKEGYLQALSDNQLSGNTGQLETPEELEQWAIDRASIWNDEIRPHVLRGIIIGLRGTGALPSGKLSTENLEIQELKELVKELLPELITARAYSNENSKFYERATNLITRAEQALK